MEKLFSYGTLQLESVQLETFGRLLQGKRDTLTGYLKTEVKITDHDVIKKSGTDMHTILKFTGIDSDRVKGTIFEVSALELKRADDYEVDAYRRIKSTFKSGTTAWVYTATERFIV